MNRIKPSWVGSICLTILLFLLCACSTTTGIQFPSDQAMMSEQPPNDGHRQNILTTSGNSAGIAILIDQQHGQLWLTEDFAHV